MTLRPAVGAPAIDLAEAESPLVLAVDIGTSSARALLYDARARPTRAAAQSAYELTVTAEGAAEDDPDQAVERTAGCIDSVLSQAGPHTGRIGAVAVDTLATTTVGLDATGRPVTPLITYADTRNSQDAAALRVAMDEAAVHDRTGCMLRSSYWPARLAWMRRTQPEIWKSANRWATLGEYFETRLFGHGRVSYSAAAWTGLLDRRQLVWDAPLREHLGLPPEWLAPLVDMDAPVHGLTGAYAMRWPALREVPWFPAIGDGAAANIGSGCATPGRVALTLGTTGAIRAVRAEVAAVPAGLFCYRVDGRLELLGGATSEGGNIYSWLRDLLRLGDPEAVEAGLAVYPPDGHALTVLPFLAGERSPGWAGNVPATLHGLTQATTPLDVLRASLEAVAYRFAAILERLSPPAGARLIASGSALRHSPAWAQIFADVLGRPLAISAEPEATSRGAVLMALRSLGFIPQLDALPAAEGDIFVADPQRHAVYQAAIARQDWLYRQLVESRPH